ncbi:MAG TPA: tetratricopeptide repeat protein [Verrucomicrobiae bacterium]|nr:tetratricopeptide repeat protein [Verrucomicrobiae bacterium]
MPEDPIDRYARGELPPGESRGLALKSLEDPELFEDLTAIALAKAAVAPGARPAALRWPRHAPMWMAAAVAAGLVLVAVYGLKTARTPAPRARPPLAWILLAGGMQARDTAVFRGSESESREPRTLGHVVKIEDGIATIDLGALDGLAKGSELESAGGRRLLADAVFRERTEARLPGAGKFRVDDEVRVPASTHLRALLDQTDARYARGNVPAARAAAVQAAQFAESNKLPELAAASNRLAVLMMLGGDNQAAELLLRRAFATAARTDPAYAESTNNLGVLAEIGNDRRRAAERYAEALAAADSVPEAERRVIESNLARARGLP